MMAGNRVPYTTISLHPFPKLSFTSHHRLRHNCRHRHHRCLLKSPPRVFAQISLTVPTSSPTLQPNLNKTGVIIVGVGLTGLAAAIRLHHDNIPFLLVEASDAVGGRVRRDSVDGFLLDRGFQIFITGYPEARKLLDYEALDLQKFYSGAKVYYGGSFHTVADPLRHFTDAIQSLINPIRTLIDKSPIALTRIRVLLVPKKTGGERGMKSIFYPQSSAMCLIAQSVTELTEGPKSQRILEIGTTIVSLLVKGPKVSVR